MTSLALIGGAFGSEGKGVIAAGLAHHFDVAIRVGGPNAGHSFYYRGELYKMRSVPCAWVSPTCVLAIGPGAVIDPVLLLAEAARVRRRISVDPMATIITEEQHRSEVDAGMRASIGSTTEGVGAARIAKMRRDGSAVLAKDYFPIDAEWVEVFPTSEIIASRGGLTMLEGAQGALLSLHHGNYPFVTSADTNAAQLAADAGLPPTDVEHTHLVIRVYPIRVAGNSGATGGKETAFEDLPNPPALPERTTVTKNVRRVFEFSDSDLERAIRLNDPCGLWVNFADYLSDKATDAADIDELLAIPEVSEWFNRHIFSTGRRLLGVGVGGKYWRVIETGDACHRPFHHRSRTWGLRQENDDVDQLPF